MNGEFDMEKLQETVWFSFLSLSDFHRRKVHHRFPTMFFFWFGICFYVGRQCCFSFLWLGIKWNFMLPMARECTRIIRSNTKHLYTLKKSDNYIVYANSKYDMKKCQDAEWFGSPSFSDFHQWKMAWVWFWRIQFLKLPLGVCRCGSSMGNLIIRSVKIQNDFVSCPVPISVGGKLHGFGLGALDF